MRVDIHAMEANNMDRCRPHTLPPTRLYLAHLAPYLAETEIELQAELKQIEAENENLAQGLQGQRDEVERLVAGLETVVRDLEAANEVMDGVVEEVVCGRNWEKWRKN